MFFFEEFQLERYSYLVCLSFSGTPNDEYDL